MVVPLAFRVVLIAVFAAVGGLHLLRCLNGSLPFVGAGVERVNDVVHLLMGVEMVAMTWGGRDRWDVQLTVFAVATGWFAIQAIGVLPFARLTADVGQPDRSIPDGHRRATPAPRQGRVVCARTAGAQHAIVAAIMTWMIAAMPVVGSPAAASTSVHMSAMATPAVPTADHIALSPYLGALLGGYLLLTTPWWLLVADRTFRRRRSAAPRWTGDPVRFIRRVAAGPAVGVTSHAAMAAAMGAVLVAVK
jgi:Domain of unknown function (DUF5134)